MRFGQISQNRMKLSNKLLIRMLLSYALVALIPLLLGWGLFQQSSELVFEKELQSIRSNLHSSRDNFDRAIISLSDVLAAVFMDEDLQRYAGEENPHIARNNVNAFLVAQRRIALLGHMSNLLDDIILYSPTANAAITRRTIILDMDYMPIYLNNTYRGFFWPDNPIHDFRERLATHGRVINIPNYYGTEALLLQLERVNWGNVSCYLIMVVSPRNVQELMHYDGVTGINVINSHAMSLSGSLTYGFTGEELLSIEDYAIINSVNGERYLITAISSNITDARLVSITPYSHIAEILSSQLSIFLIIMVLVALTCIALCVGFVWLNILPLEKITALLFGENVITVGNNLTWNEIDSSIRKLASDRKQLRDDLSVHTEYLKSTLFNDLLNDREGNQERIINRLKRLSFPVSGSYWVLTLELQENETSSEPAAVSLLIRRIIEQSMEQIFHVADVTKRRYVILLKNMQTSYEAIAEHFNLWQSELKESLNLEIRGCIGLADSLEQVPLIYREEMLALEWRDDKSGGIIKWEKSLPAEREAYFQPDLLHKILSPILNGNQVAFETLLDTLYEERFASKDISDMQIQLMWEQVFTCIELSILRMPKISESSMLNVIKLLRTRSNFENNVERMNRIKSLMVPIFHEFNDPKEEASLYRKELSRRIVLYIQENLSNQELSLNSVADFFNLSTPYISSLVKIETGFSFSSYCERSRINKASDFLKEGKSINEAAQAAGYYSSHTFRRAFKKVTGVVPSQYVKGALQTKMFSI